MDTATTTAAVIGAFQRFAGLGNAGWSRQVDGAFAWVTGVDLATLNGVIVERPETVNVATVASLLDRVAETGLSHCLQVRPVVNPPLAQLARSRGLIPQDSLPLMAIHRSRLTAAGRFVRGFDIRAATPADVDLLARVAAGGFGGPVDAFNDLVAMAFLADGLRSYLAYVDGEPAGTAMGLTTSDILAVFTVSAMPDQRRRGIGTALTARAVLDGYSAGCTWSWLQSSAMAHNLYRRLGFMDLEEWTCWVAAH